jgi:hypothetical protein
MQSRTGVMRIRRLEKEENVRTLVKKNDSQVMNEKRYERPVRSKDIEEKENIIGTLTKKKRYCTDDREKKRRTIEGKEVMEDTREDERIIKR